MVTHLCRDGHGDRRIWDFRHPPLARTEPKKAAQKEKKATVAASWHSEA